MLKIQLDGKFHSSYKQFIVDYPLLDKEVEKRVNWFKKNPNDTRLRNHLLKKRMKGKYAFSINGDVRIVYEWLGKNKVRFLAIGGHNRVYTS
ncbi:MAG: hypothetical protein Q7T59_00605 [Candidatus Woesebacteria bacterium]|nr:hypothetical protein [Candidatus Woesebacteria bacterium]